MTGLNDRFRDRSFPELLAAYADGELDAAGRARVEAWLAAHPEARAELENQRKLSRTNSKLWHTSSPPSPGERSWSRLFVRVHTALANRPATAEPTRGAPRFRFGAAALAAAAAVLFAIGLFRPGEPAPVDPSPSSDETVLVMADPADIDIQSIQDADTELLVIGQPPLIGLVVLAAPGDIQLEKVAKDTDGMMPREMVAGANVPMLCVPMAGR
jgi:anti-sigma-K factor RskA